ncbi:iron uptake porin [Spirulina sp. CS-785/01]|uniref:iron uptake porin n=1 Tax=Spirulina sp. CS-785/01 TaxID=3021716 RepID=UPI0023314A2A|nr:iron uptake porin [Spirulina sp. CS-785/01]MDB9314338.1 iron uptake porin [Spirulina sp. CS-785/01]
MAKFTGYLLPTLLASIFVVPEIAIAQNAPSPPPFSLYKPAKLDNPPPRNSHLELAPPIPLTSLDLPNQEEVNHSTQQLLEDLRHYSNEAMGQQGLGATQFQDVSPTDWAFAALNDLNRRYDCLQGYPDSTFRGNRPLSRYEFAAGVNACVQQIERLIAATTTEFVTQSDLETLQRLVQDFEAEIATLETRVDNLEARVSDLEMNQFSTTTKLNGEVLFILSEFFNGTQPYDLNGSGEFDLGDNLVEGGKIAFQNRVRLNFDTSFTGRDRLRTRLQARNIETFTALDGTVTREGQFGFAGDNDNTITLSKLEYRFPFGSRAEITVGATGIGLDDLASPLNPFESSGGGSISRFGRYNPIYRHGGQEAGIGLRLAPNDSIALELGYTAGEPGTAGPSSGVFNGDYAMIGQATFTPSDSINLAATYVHGYRSGGVRPGVGSLASDLRGFDFPVVSNAYGVEALFSPSSQFFVGGWVGYTAAQVINTGEADIWNYAITLGINDLGTEGSQLGLIFGQEPRLTDGTESLGNLGFEGLQVGLTSDHDVGFHIEGFYKIQVTDNVEITPGVIWLTNPNHNQRNPDIVVGTIRTRFQF